MIAYTPEKLEQIPDCLKKMTNKSKIIGGGTDLIIKLQNTSIENKPDALCYFGRIDELRQIHESEDNIYIGAYVTMTELGESSIIKKYFTALVNAASDVGSLQIRNNATIAGNIGNASPAGDLLPVLVLYDAKIEVTSPNFKFQISILDIIERPGKLSIKYNEVITGIVIPKPDFKSAFVKLGFRKKVTISRIGVAIGVKMKGDYVDTAKIIIGAISVKPVRLEKAEEFLNGRTINEANIMKVSNFLSDLIMKITPKEFDRDYKVFASKGIIQDVFELLEKDL